MFIVQGVPRFRGPAGSPHAVPHPSRCWSRRDNVLAKPRAYLLPREWVRGPRVLIRQQNWAQTNACENPNFTDMLFFFTGTQPYITKPISSKGTQPSPAPADFPTWEPLAAALQLFPYSAVCLSCSRVWVSQIMMWSGFACEILHNSTPIVRLGQAVRPYSVFSLHNVCKSIRRKPEQCDDSGWLDQALVSQAPVTQEFHRNSQF